MRPTRQYLCLLAYIWLIGQSAVALKAQELPPRVAPQKAPESGVPERPEPEHPEDTRDAPDREDPDPDDPEPGPGPGPGPPAAPDPVHTLPRGARLTWDQPTTARVALSQIAFRLFVNGAPQALPDVRCVATSAPAVHSCSAAVPALGAGVHALSIAAVDGDDESLRSEPILVRVAAASGTSGQATRSTSPGARTETLFDEPTALLAITRQLTLVAERAGTVRVLRDGRLEPGPALTLSSVTTGEGRGLLALAAGPDVSSTGVVYSLYSTTRGLRVERYQLVGDRLVAPAVIIDALPAPAHHPKATIGHGPDGTLFVALGDGGRPDRGADRGDWAGKLLHFNADGTTPRTRGAGSPVLLTGLQGPASLAWDEHSQMLWLADRAADGSLLLYRTSAAGAGAVAVTLPLPEAAAAVSIAVAGGPGATSVWAAVVSERGSSLGVWRLEATGDGIVQTMHPTKLGAGAPVRSLVFDGVSALVFCTANAVGRVEPGPR